MDLSFLDVSVFQWSACFFSFIYLLFAIRNHRICFVFGLIGAILWAIESYFNLQLKFDASLQIFYAIVSIIGFFKWKNSEKIINGGLKKAPIKFHVTLIFFGTILSGLMLYFAQHFISTNYAFLDAFTTIFSVLATFLLVYRYIENWIYFIVVDILYVYIYYKSDAHIFVVMMILYTFLAISGYIQWKKIRAPLQLE